MAINNKRAKGAGGFNKRAKSGGVGKRSKATRSKSANFNKRSKK